MGLILDGINFELNTNTRQTAFFVETENGKIVKYGYDISFQPADTSVKSRKKANFKLDCWLPVITDVKYWEKFGL